MDKPLVARLSLGIAFVMFAVYVFFVLARWIGIGAVSALFGGKSLFALLLIMSALFTISILIYEDIRDKESSEQTVLD